MKPAPVASLDCLNPGSFFGATLRLRQITNCGCIKLQQMRLKKMSKRTIWHKAGSGTRKLPKLAWLKTSTKAATWESQTEQSELPR